MTEKQEYNYELLCLVDKTNEEKYERFVKDAKLLLTPELFNNVKFTEKGWKIAYPIKKLQNGQYLLINFSSKPEQARQLKKDFLQINLSKCLNRYMLINLTREKKVKTKINLKQFKDKKEEKNVE